MNLICSIIGFPNVGKSTIFNALTHSNVETKNFPFCTIKPNIGKAVLKDNRAKKLAEIVKLNNVVYGKIDFMDTAGLVKDAHIGKGLGNDFLEDICNSNIIFHVVRCFKQEDVPHFLGEISPKKDIEIINNELILSDLLKCEKIISKIEKEKKQNYLNKKSLLKRCLIHLNKNMMLNKLTLSKEEKYLLFDFNFLTIKPIIYIANLDINQSRNIFLEQVSSVASIEETSLLTIHLFKDFNPNNLLLEEYRELNKLLKLELNKIIYYGYNLLKLKTFFTINNTEVRSWIVADNTNALQAANKIHTDFSKGFIKAKVISFFDFVNYQGESGVKKAGKIRYEGKNYNIKDGEIIKFLFQRKK